MVDKAIREKIEALGFGELIDFTKVKQYKREPSKRLREATEKNDFVILGKGDLKDFYSQPVVVIPIDDFFGMLQATDISRFVFKNKKQ